MARGKGKDSEARKAKVAELLAKGMTQSQIKDALSLERSALWRSIQDLDVQANLTEKSLQDYIAYRERQLAELIQLKQVAIESEDLDDRDRIACLLQISDRIVALLKLDSNHMARGQETPPEIGQDTKVIWDEPTPEAIPPGGAQRQLASKPQQEVLPALPEQKALPPSQEELDALRSTELAQLANERVTDPLEGWDPNAGMEITKLRVNVVKRRMPSLSANVPSTPQEDQ